MQNVLHNDDERKIKQKKDKRNEVFGRFGVQSMKSNWISNRSENERILQQSKSFRFYFLILSFSFSFVFDKCHGTNSEFYVPLTQSTFHSSHQPEI